MATGFSAKTCFPVRRAFLICTYLESELSQRNTASTLLSLKMMSASLTNVALGAMASPR